VWLQRRPREGRPVQQYEPDVAQDFCLPVGVCACGSLRPRGMKTGFKHRGAGRGRHIIDRPPVGHEETWRVCVVEQLMCVVGRR
jgi:hypothetical protein